MNSGQHPKTVAIVGAGVSGLVTAKVLQADGFSVTVFDKQGEIGGVWASSRTYPQLRTNNTRELYEYSDLAYPEAADAFPTAEQVRSYLRAYVDRFELDGVLQLGEEVVSVSRETDECPWRKRFVVATRSTAGSTVPVEHHFDHVAVCNGVFSSPHIPSIDGVGRFTGRVLHSSQLTSTDELEGRRVIVVGAGKSALDCAAVAADHGSSCRLVFRSPRWMAPQYVLGVRYDWLFMNRLLELFYGYHRQGRVEAFLHGPAKPVVRLFWQIQSWIARRATRAPDQLVPDEPLPSGLENLGVGAEFYDAVQERRALLTRAEVEAFTGGSSVRLSNGETVDADAVIFATGWQQHLDFLAEELRQQIRVHGTFRLYRHILPPREQGLGFVGYASSLINTLTSEIAAHWLSQHFRGELHLPPAEEMEQEIDRVQYWAQQTFPAASEGYFIGPYVAHHVDELLRDMGLPTQRTRNVLTEYLGRLLPRRYGRVHQQRTAARRADAQPH
jgi:cation diffusion facilitator CzcD-associated flavoprotein CzcO